MRLALFAAALVEAVMRIMLLGYGPFYVHQVLHGGYLASSQAAALPSLAVFLGSLAWGQLLSKIGVRRIAMVGIFGYCLLGVVIWHVSQVLGYLIGVSGTVLLCSALAPATLTALTAEGGQMGRRLASLLRWQSAGWLMAGLVGGWLMGLAARHYTLIMLVPGLAALVPLGWLWTRRGLVEPTASSAAPAFVSSPGLSHWRITALIILPFFLTYAGNEGFFTNFSLYLHVVHTPASWVGWSASISTVIGYALSGFFGRSADRLGGRRLFQTILLAYVLMYALMLAVPRPIVDVAVFSLPMYPVLSMSVVRASAERVKAGQLSSVMGVINGTTGLATSLGSTAMGVVAARLSPRAMPWLADALAILAWAMVLAIRERQPAWKEEAS